MKKLLFLGALAAMLLGTASCSNENEPALADGMVQFKVELPGNIESRAIADGLTANKLTVAVYDAEGNELTELKVNKDIPHETTVTFQLVKGQTYSFAFWAQAEGAPYTFDTANKKVDVDYTNAVCNDESRDAFFAYVADLTVNNNGDQTVTLYRPFAQLNFGASDVEAARKAGIVAEKSKVTVSQVSKVFDLVTGEASAESDDIAEDVVFGMAEIPNDPATLVVEGENYGWMAMNYFLVPGNEATIETTLDLYVEGAAEAEPVRELEVANVPVQKNHRTNIVGNLFTEDLNFNVIIDEAFDQPDNNIVLLSSSAAVQGAAAVDGAVVDVAPGSVISLDLTQVGENVTIKGNGSKLLLNRATCTLAKEGLTLEGFTIDNTETYSAAIIVNASTFTLKDCTFETSAAGHNYGVWLKNMTEDGVYTFDGVVFDNQPMGRCLVIECKGTVNINNCVLNARTYTLSTYDIVSDCDINATNTQFIGWTSFNTGANHTYRFNNCYFGKLNYGYFRPYGQNGTNVVYMDKCTFSNDYQGINPIDGITFYITESAFENDDAITAANLVDADGAGSLLADGNVYLDGVLIYNGATDHN